MPKAILYTAVTLDGYIADAQGGIEFLDHPLFRLPDEDYGYSAFYESIDAVIMGHNTFEKINHGVTQARFFRCFLANAVTGIGEGAEKGRYQGESGTNACDPKR